MKVRDLIERLNEFDEDLEVHLEVFGRGGNSIYGHVLFAELPEHERYVVITNHRAFPLDK